MKRKQANAFTLLEIVVSLTVITVVVTGILALFPLGMAISRDVGWMTTATLLGQRQVEMLRQTGFSGYQEMLRKAGFSADQTVWIRDENGFVCRDQPLKTSSQPPPVGTLMAEEYCGIWDDPTPAVDTDLDGDIEIDPKTPDGVNDYPDYFWLARVEPHPDPALADLRRVTVYIFHVSSRGAGAVLPGTWEQKFVTYIGRH